MARKDKNRPTSDECNQSIAKHLEALGLRIHEIEGDGNCLFRALSDQLDGNDKQHLKYRKEVVDYIKSHKDDFAPFLEDDVSFEKHVNEMRTPGTFAGNDAIVAFARLYKVSVIIHQFMLPALEIKGGDEKLDTLPQLHLSYHNNEHYNSVRKENDFSLSPPNVKTVKTPNNKETFVDDIEFVSRCTGCNDVPLIEETLKDVNYDREQAIDIVQSIAALTAAEANDNAANDAVSSCAVKSVSKRDRKILKREQRTSRRKGDSSNPNASHQDEIIQMEYVSV